MASLVLGRPLHLLIVKLALSLHLRLHFLSYKAIFQDRASLGPPILPQLYASRFSPVSALKPTGQRSASRYLTGPIMMG